MVLEAAVNGGAGALVTINRRDSALRLQPSLLEEARKLAQAEGVALNQLINVAVAEKPSALRTESYFAERPAAHRRQRRSRSSKRAGVGRPPMKGDEMRRRKRR